MKTWLAAVAAVLLAGGCTTPSAPHVPVPSALADVAVVDGCETARFAGNGAMGRLEQAVAEAIGSSCVDGGGEVVLLALSAGGERGAFGAGVLAGWTERGDRPAFRVVCGVSSGALLAPFAFVGPEMDGRMREAFTEARNRDLFRVRSVFALPQADALTTTEPLLATLTRLIDDEVLAAVARGHAEGRRLYVLTTDFDAVRPVVWDMGAIASSGRVDAPLLFRRVLMASAAVPVAFPPQYFAVSADDAEYDEMHCDGGLMRQVFLPLASGVRREDGRPVRVYVVLNNSVGTAPLEGPPRLVPLVTRSFQVMQRMQALADLERIGQAARRAGCELLLASMPVDGGSEAVRAGQRPGFDPRYMADLFEIGCAIGRRPDGFAVLVSAKTDAGD